MALAAEEFKFPSEDPRSVLFQSDTLLADQYHALFRRTNHLEPEKRLMMAILEDAISCFQKYLLAKDKKGKELFREAEEWIMEEDPDWLFSFDNVCENLELDPDYLRRGLLHWKEMKLREGSTAKVYQGVEKPCSQAGQKGPGLRACLSEYARRQARCEARSYRGSCTSFD